MIKVRIVANVVGGWSQWPLEKKSLLRKEGFNVKRVNRESDGRNDYWLITDPDEFEIYIVSRSKKGYILSIEDEDASGQMTTKQLYKGKNVSRLESAILLDYYS